MSVRLPFVALTLLAACEGVVGEPPGTVEPPDVDAPAVCTSPPDVFPVRRLTAIQILNTARAALGTAMPIRVEDERLGTFPSNGSVAVDANMASAIGTWASDVATAATPGVLAECTDDASCMTRLTGPVGRVLFRRPLDADSQARMERLFTTVAAQSDLETAVRSVLEAMLQSPYFLYQVEHEDGPDSWSQLARLTYALWNTGADDALLDRVGELAEPATAEALVQDMLADERFDLGLDAFVAPWLLLEKLDDSNRRTDLHGELTPEALSALREQARHFVLQQIAQGGEFSDLFRASNVPAAPLVRDLVGDDVVEERDGQWVFDTERRMGLLGLPGVLAANSGPESSSPTHRGVMVLTNLLCSPPPAPPANVSTELPEIEGATTRQRMESHVADPTCASCHRSIDGIGFTFEHYDWFGRYRTEENGLPIDSTGTLYADGTAIEVSDAIDLSEALSQSQQARECFAEMWLTYAGGRSPKHADACLLEEMTATLDQPDGLRGMLVRLFSSAEFLRSALSERNASESAMEGGE